MELHFSKYQATGNDFILIDDRGSNFPITDHELVSALCDRRFGIGADGLILLRKEPGFDFRMMYFNADGNLTSFCGNGGRAIVRFAKDLGLIGVNANFMATDGKHFGTLMPDGEVSLELLDVKETRQLNDGAYFLNTGSPHYVAFVPDVAQIDVQARGAAIRYNLDFGPGGTNVNFVELYKNNIIKVRTYERGVEGETYSCGTGVTAAALAAYKFLQTNKIFVITKGGELVVKFSPGTKEGSFEHISLTGAVHKVYEGHIHQRPRVYINKQVEL
jgi:diaminopimelate epimerase